MGVLQERFLIDTYFWNFCLIRILEYFQSSETDEDVLLEEGKSRMRHYKAYTVMQKSGFQHTE